MYTIFESINLLINKPVSQVGQEVTQQLFLARIMSRPDSCNSVLVGLPTSTMQSLQCVWIRNAAAQLAFSLSHFDHVKPTLIQPQWLPVSYEIKLCAASSTSSTMVVGWRIGQKWFSQSAPADHVSGYAHLLPRRWTTLYHSCA